MRRHKNSKRAALTAEELGRFLAALDAPWFRERARGAGIFWTLGATGARPWEVLGYSTIVWQVPPSQNSPVAQSSSR